MSYAMGEKELLLELRAQGASIHDARDLVALAGALALVPDPEIDASFADALEARLMTEGLEQAPVPAGVTPIRSARPARHAAPVRPAAQSQTIATVTPLGRRRFVVRKAIVAAVAAAMLMALPVAAGANALPSSPAYGVKMAMEQIRMALTFNDLAKGFYLLQVSETRLGETGQELALGHDAVAAATADKMKATQREAAKLILGGSPSDADLMRAESTLRDLAKRLATLLPNANVTSAPSILDTIRSGEALANTVAAERGAPAAPALTLPAAAPAAVTVTGDASPTGSTSQDKASQTDGRTSKGPVDDKTDDTDTRVHDGTQTACQVPGAANGLGEILAPAGKVICGR